MIFAREKCSSTGKVCPTARFEKRTPENKGRSTDNILKKDDLRREQGKMG